MRIVGAVFFVTEGVVNINVVLIIQEFPDCGL